MKDYLLFTYIYSTLIALQQSISILFITMTALLLREYSLF